LLINICVFCLLFPWWCFAVCLVYLVFCCCISCFVCLGLVFGWLVYYNSVAVNLYLDVVLVLGYYLFSLLFGLFYFVFCWRYVVWLFGIVVCFTWLVVFDFSWLGCLFVVGYVLVGLLVIRLGLYWGCFWLFELVAFCVCVFCICLCRCVFVLFAWVWWFRFNSVVYRYCLFGFIRLLRWLLFLTLSGFSLILRFVCFVVRFWFPCCLFVGLIVACFWFLGVCFLGLLFLGCLFCTVFECTRYDLVVVGRLVWFLGFLGLGVFWFLVLWMFLVFC